MCLLASAACAAEAKIELTGILATAGCVRLALRNTASGTSTWLKVGDSFYGYRLTAFEPATETAVLVRDGVIARIKLADPNPSMAAADEYFLESGTSSTTLTGIGREVGLSAQQMAQLNNITDPMTLQVGQVLRLK
jgi:hypothetical protein